MTREHHYLVRDSDGARLCQDGYWRTFTGFGTYRCCAKVWRQIGWANREKNRRSNCRVLSLPHGQFMDAAGNIFQEDENGNDNLIQKAETLVQKSA